MKEFAWRGELLVTRVPQLACVITVWTLLETMRQNTHRADGTELEVVALRLSVSGPPGALHLARTRAQKRSRMPYG